MVNKYCLIISSLLFSSFSYSCTEERPCLEGLKALKIFRDNMDKNHQCKTSLNQLQEISNQLILLEEHILANDSLKLWYARYLCSQYDIAHGFHHVSNLNENIQKGIDITQQDLATTNYIKGLALYSALFLSSVQEHKVYREEFIKHLGRLVIKEKNIQVYDDAIRLILNRIAFPTTTEYYDQFRDNEIINIFKKHLDINHIRATTNIIKLFYQKLSVVNNQDIIDGFFKYYFNLLRSENIEIAIPRAIKSIYKQNLPPSDFIQFLYSFELANNKQGTSGLNACAKFLQSRIDKNQSFKLKSIEYMFFDRLGQVYKALKEFDKAISCFESIVDYKMSMQPAFELFEIYFETKKYKEALEFLKKAKAFPNLDNTENKKLGNHIKTYLFLLDKVGDPEKYDEELAAYNQKILENRLNKNARWVKKVKKFLELKALEDQARMQREINQQSVRLKDISLSHEEKQKGNENNNSFAPALENLKKEYNSVVSINKKKTRGVVDPARVVEEVIPVAIVDKPIVPIEAFIKNNAYDIFCCLFSCYENPPIMDDHLKISPDQIATLMKALDVPFAYCGSGSSHMKATLKDDSEEYMIIIPHREYIGPHYIKSLREIFLSMGLYPEYLKEILQSKGLLK